MSYYPIIKSDVIDIEKIGLSEPNINTKTHENISISNSDNIKITLGSVFANHKVTYDYDRVGINKLCILTDFLTIHKVPTKQNNTIQFTVKMDQEAKLKGIFNSIETVIRNKYPEIGTVKFPTNKNIFNNDHNFVNFQLFTYNNSVVSSIHYHKTKKQGQGIQTIYRNTTDNTLECIMSNMNMFKYNYMKPRDDCPLLYYESKFILEFHVDIFGTIDQDGITKYTSCNVNIYIKEMETKSNKTFVKSILDIDVIDLSTRNNNDENKLAI
jgi:hypothetical protein